MAIDPTFQTMGQDWLADQLTQSCGVAITYYRDNDAISLTNVVVGRTAFRTVDQNGGSRLDRSAADFLIRVSDLVLDDNPLTPQRGDQIRRTIGDVVYVYEVRPFEGENPWRWADPHHQMFRVHTKLLRTE